MAHSNFYREDSAEADISIWKEALFGADILLLHASPIYYGFGVPHGNGSGVIVIPGFLGTDLYLSHLQSWLKRVGYQSYLSGIGLNAECPNLLIQNRLNETISQAVEETGKKVHLIGHSLGGIMARSVANRRPDDIASVITLAAPFRGTVAHHSILRAAETVRKQIHREHGAAVLPQCYTAKCTCDFVTYLRCEMPESIRQTAIYTRDDGIVDWHYCKTGDAEIDCEVPGTHIGLAFNASVYKIIAERLAAADTEQ
jgi:pimeloyl-ACP methyl ester carboxylesterase